ncbi:phage holin family protein [Anaerococcus sp. AGMB00486]|uniref:Phage holin family protein n=1 Tax=Anaerococcus faecalis TaxID=2742993 RepID=A0ABX2N9U1_9FIRM|nr:MULTISPECIES: phage holin family protein [Anaerococcus]MDY3007314.1 phage holin family protein [Anaerococcus porci]MDY3737572.1 phage holin family protein [Peptoniphilaceae bacterium]NVF11466.1 phage holin family protein [Anaerococcus faecalis]
MNKFLETVKICFAALGGYLGFYLGSIDAFIYTLIAFVIADYITGVLRAGVEKKLSSAIGFKGIAKKIMIFIVVGIANLCDVNLIKGDGTAVRCAIIFFYIANEGLSILENSVALGLPVPEKLKTLLEQFKEDK